MTNAETIFQFPPHDHVFLGEDHDRAERRTWAVIILCSVMMIAEIIGGALFGSLALIADGLHMSTHAGALLLAALAYTYARKYANDRAFTFGTGKFGDLAGYSSAIVLAMIALLISYEAVSRLLTPVPISFNEAIPIAVLGLVVNVASAWLLSGGHHHGHSHGHSQGHDHDHDGDEPRRIELGTGAVEIEVFEDNVPPRFRVRADTGVLLAAPDVTIETIRPDGGCQLFAFEDRGGYLESRDEIPVPHAFLAKFRLVQGAQHHDHELAFEEHDHDHHHQATHGAHHRDNNMRAAVIHVLLDRTPDPRMAEKVRMVIESEGDQVTDLHLWRLGPGHLGVIVSVATSGAREAAHYRQRLAKFADLSHVTVEVQHCHSTNG